MTISTKGRYALRMLIDMAEQPGDECISLRDIATRQNISKKYLEQIATKLTQEGLLQVTRGNHGGYRLTKLPEKISVGEVLRVMEGSMSPTPCAETDLSSCDKCGECRVLPVWQGLDRVIRNYVDNITVKELCGNNAFSAVLCADSSDTPGNEDGPGSSIQIEN